MSPCSCDPPPLIVHLTCPPRCPRCKGVIGDEPLPIMVDPRIEGVDPTRTYFGGTDVFAYDPDAHSPTSGETHKGDAK